MSTVLHSASRRSALIAAATVGYVVVVIIASAYPLSGWRLPDRQLLWLQLGEWPRYYSYSDVIANVLAYVPVGGLLTWWLRHRLGPVRAAGLAMVMAGALSFVLEVFQGTLPARVTSGLDVFCNTVGGIVGAWLGLAWNVPGARHSALGRWRDNKVAEGIVGDAALVLLAYWLFLQFRPDVWLFALGDFRHILSMPAGEYSALNHVLLEAAATCVGLAAVAGFCSCFARNRPWKWFIALSVTGILVHSSATWLYFEQRDPVLWFTPGNAAGLIAGVGLGSVVCRLPFRSVLTVTFAAIVVAAALVSAAPANPYGPSGYGPPSRPGHLRNIAGTTEVLGALWPLLAIGALAVRGRSVR